jgi:crotonobetainyl-CoA:carnitine CoA-transferase CaiB-like acyl-CoA transferase
MARLPLEDIKIIDFGWVIACPHGTRLLADLGAQVIKVESKAKLDGLRGDFQREGVTNPLEEGGAVFQEQNRNKMSLALNVKNPKGMEILGRLIRIADAVTANFSSVGFKKLGLEWEELSKFNPGIIVVSMPGMGNWGPHSHFMTFGPNLQALAGITSLMGYPNQEPVGSGVPWVDYMGGGALAIAILAAVEYRRKTGKGQFIDISQHEVALSFIGSVLLDWAANKRVSASSGNHHHANGAVPHNCYRCKGDDRWCVISVASDEEWDNFCKALENPDWTKNPRFATHLQRVINQEELDKLIEAWMANYYAEEIVETMQEAGVSAGVVQNIEDILKRDPHLRERGFLEEVKLPPHPDKKPASFTIPGVVTRLLGQSLSIRHPAPALLGQDNEHILKDMLGMTELEIEQAAAEGAFS